ncbi:hypothetical protein D043_1305A, partial [Vibrio parahaemolyticus EKP-021]
MTKVILLRAQIL